MVLKRLVQRLRVSTERAVAGKLISQRLDRR